LILQKKKAYRRKLQHTKKREEIFQMKTKIFIITGFLGSGKTTLLKHILKFTHNLSNTIVLVNEFGKVGIDASLIRKTAPADIVELSSGCICCSLKTDMILTLKNLWEKYKPESVVIEASGVADPLAIIQSLGDEMLSDHFQLTKTITVVDGDFWEARQAFGQVFKNQIHQADLILLNKIDTFEKTAISVMLKEIKTTSVHAIVLPTFYCNIDPEILWSEVKQKKQFKLPGSIFKRYDPENDLSAPMNKRESKLASAKEAGFVSFSFETKQFFDKKEFVKFIDAQPLELFRIKGPVRFAHKTKMLNFVGGKSEYSNWTDNEDTCLTFIGWNVDKKTILKKLESCILA